MLETQLLFADAWTIAGVIVTVLSIALAAGGLVIGGIRKWRKQVEEEEEIDERIVTTLFGQDAKPPYPKIDGLVTSHAELVEAVAQLHPRVDELEDSLNTISRQVGTLVERTEENGGKSIKDQINRIERYILDRQLVDLDPGGDKHQTEGGER